MIIISKKINYEEKLDPVYIESMEANHVYMNDLKKSTGQAIEYKIKNQWVAFNEISTRKSVLADSLFLRYMNSCIVRKKRNGVYDCLDFIVLRFKYDATYRISGVENKISKHELRDKYYEDGVDYTFVKKNKYGEIVEEKTIHYKMLMRSTGKAKAGDCVFINEKLHKKAINFLTMGFYDLMDKESKKNPEKVFRLVELSAYQTLTTAKAEGFIRIPFENILIIEDKEVYSDGMKAAIVKNETFKRTKEGEFEPDFENPRLEDMINKKGLTLDPDKAAQNPKLTLVKEKTKKALKDNGIRFNGKYPGYHPEVEYESTECTVTMSDNEKIKNTLWDGMGLIDDEFFPSGMEGFIYCRSHFFKSCLFRGNIQEFFKDYCDEYGLDYDTYTVEKSDMFHRELRLRDIKVIITDKSIKWCKKFIDMMGGTEQKAFEYYSKWMEKQDYYFSIVKTAHPSKIGDMQLSTYQMNNSLPTTDVSVLRNISDNAINIINDLKMSDEKYIQYLEMKTSNKNDAFSMDKVLLELVKWNSNFMKTEFFRTKKSNDIGKIKADFCEGRLPQVGDNLTIMDNPIALLLAAVGDDPLNEGCFNLRKDGVECYTPRFKEGECLAAFRSPHNSPNNIIHLYNVFPDKLLKYFPNIGNNVIVFNAIKTDTQARLSGHDVDSDFVYVTNQPDLAELAKLAYTEYPTIINDVTELGSSDYHFTLKDYATMDNSISDAQESIGTSTDVAQLALSYYYDGNIEDKKLQECFIILSVIGQISIDLAKKTFDIDVVKEIRRIRNLPCMKKKYVPKFFANTKKSRNNKDFGKGKVQAMNCPMDIMARLIDDKVIPYAPRHPHEFLLRDLLNKGVIGKGNKDKKRKVIEQAEVYNSKSKWLESHESEFKKSTYYLLRQGAITQFLHRAKKNLDQETIMHLVIFATKSDNSDICGVIFNFLYEAYRDEFLNCFVKSEQKQEKIIA